jgi:lysine-ketoglutarate reductase/saccharopine dehydrogenase-like protein (TIGR00300 family)
MNTIPKYITPDFNQGKFANSPDVATATVKMNGIAPDNYHATSMYPEYYKINGQWRLIEQIRMDCVPVIREDGSIEAVEFRRLKEGDCAVLGRNDDGTEGIYLHSDGFSQGSGGGSDTFSFRSGRSRETSFQRDYQNLADLLKHDKDKGYIIWVLGPAAVFSNEVRKAMEYILDNGYAHAVFGGNAVVTHDLEGALLNTALGQDIDTGENKHNGHYNHLDTINMVNRAGSVRKAIGEYGLDNGVIYSCVKNDIPFVMAASLRDDGPMTGVLNNMSEAQDAMRAHTQKATSVVCLASQLHTIATGNITPSYTVINSVIRPVFIYAVDISEFVLNKLRYRGSLEVTAIVSNVQDFLFKLTALLRNEA